MIYINFASIGVIIVKVVDEYRELYREHIVNKAKVIIMKYDPIKHTYVYKPYSHRVSNNSIYDLAELIIYNMVFYAFSEEEIVEHNKKLGLLDDLFNAARYAYEQRLPKRMNPDSDGTVGEVILDILIQVFEPVSQKLIARAKFKQQGDNTEIKGYDTLYFTKNNEEISLWLGQAKTGSFNYCKSDIIKDLNNKYTLKYFCDSMFFVADKAEKSNELRDILDSVNKICFDSVRLNYSDQTKMECLIELIKQKKIKLKIPCLMVYTEKKYNDKVNFEINLKSSVDEIIKTFDENHFNIIKDLEHEIIFLIFPVSDIKELRKKIINFKKEGVLI